MSRPRGGGAEMVRRLRPTLSAIVLAPAVLWLIGTTYLPISAPVLAGAALWLAAIGLTALAALSLAAHALAHAAAARGVGAPLPAHIPLGLLGDVSHAWPVAPRREALVALAGPCASLALAVVAALVWRLQPSTTLSAAALFVAVMNGLLAVLNLAPGWPFDGGRLVRLVARRATRRPERVSALLGLGLACALVAGGAAFTATESRFSGVTGATLVGLATLIVLALARPRPPQEPGVVAALPGRLRASAETALLCVVLLVPSLAFVPLPYGLYAPGGAVPVAPMIEVEGVELEATEGELLLTTVVGQTPIMAAQWLIGQLDPALAIVPPERVVPLDITPQELMAENARLLGESQAVASVVALRLAGFEASMTGSGVRVVRVLPESPARALLLPGDRIVTLEGESVRTTPDLLVALSGLDPSARAEVTVERGGERVDLSLPLLPPTEPGGTPRIGISIETADLVADTSVPVTITPRSIVGGPSAGLMFTLAIYDRVTPGDLTAGWRIAGTGTVGREGEVGPIGGVEQKVAAAERAGAAYFLAPRENVDAARRAAQRIRVLEVTHVAEAIAFLQGLPERGAEGDAPRAGAGEGEQG